MQPSFDEGGRCLRGRLPHVMVSDRACTTGLRKGKGRGGGCGMYERVGLTIVCGGATAIGRRAIGRRAVVR